MISHSGCDALISRPLVDDSEGDRLLLSPISIHERRRIRLPARDIALRISNPNWCVPLSN
jgi:hypothetical protein